MLPGTCVQAIDPQDPEPDGLDVEVEDITLRAATPGSVTLVAAPGTTGFNVQSHGVVLDGFVVESDHQGVLAAASDSDTTLQDVVLRNLEIRPPAGGSIAMSGIQVRDENGW